MGDPDSSDPGCAPGQQDVDIHIGAVVGHKRLPKAGPEGTKGADVGRMAGPDRILQRELRHQGGQVSHQAMLLSLRGAVDQITSLVQPIQQLRQLLGRMLKIIVHGHRDIEPGRAQSCEKCVVLAVIPHHAKPADPRMPLRQPAEDAPAFVAASVVHQDNLVGQPGRLKDGPKAPDEFGQPWRTIVNRDNHGQAAGWSSVSFGWC